MLKWKRGQLFRSSKTSLRKQLTFLNNTTGLPAKWCRGNEYKNSILMKRPHPDLANASDGLKQISLATQVPIRGTTQIWVVKHH